MKSLSASIRRLVLVSVGFLPIATYAQGITVVNALVNKISQKILTPLIYLMFAIASLVFIWGAKNFIGAADDAEARKTGSQQMIWGIVGAMIMLSAKVIVDIVKNTATTL